jgi:hypothetical protein
VDLPDFKKFHFLIFEFSIILLNIASVPYETQPTTAEKLVITFKTNYPMKKLKAGAMGALLSIWYVSAGAQEQKLPLNDPDYNKPKLFADLPQKMDFNLAAMDAVFKLPVGASIHAQLTGKFLFEGVVVSRSAESDSLVRSVVISSRNRQGAVFTFTRTGNPDGTFHYLGRIVSRNNGDAFEIVQENGQYVLQKKNLYDLISE